MAEGMTFPSKNELCAAYHKINRLEDAVKSASEILQLVVYDDDVNFTTYLKAEAWIDKYAPKTGNTK